MTLASSSTSLYGLRTGASRSTCRYTSPPQPSAHLTEITRSCLVTRQMVTTADGPWNGAPGEFVPRHEHVASLPRSAALTPRELRSTRN